MTRQTKDQLEFKNIMLEQELTATKLENERLREQIQGMHQHAFEQRKQIDWFKRAIECLIVPGDDKRNF